MPDNVGMFSTVIVLVPMFYLFLAAPAFLLVKLHIGPVAQLLRGMFNSYFIVLSIAAAVGAVAMATDGRWSVAAGFAVLSALVVGLRRWYLGRMDFDSEQDVIDTAIARRLRRLHWGGMLGNAIQLAALLAVLPYLAAAPA